MGKISDINKMTLNSQNEYCYEGKKIGKWWGKTLFYFNPKDQQLYYHTFSLIGLIFHLCCYKKQFNEKGLKEWLAFKKVSLTAPKKAPLKRDFGALCQDKSVTTEEIIQLFKNGMSVNAILNNRNKTVLHEACRKARFEVAKYLIDNGADINASTTEESEDVERTPLQYSIDVGYDKLTLYLLEKGADVNTYNRDREPVLHMAIHKLGWENKLKHLADELDNQRRAQYVEKFEKSNPIKVIQAILSKGIIVNLTDSKGDTALRIACLKGNLEAVKLLIEAGADPKIHRLDGPTVVGIARGNEFHEIADYLETLPQWNR